jgi:hypothetical protein
MAYTHIPTFKGDEDPRRHWIIYETIWDVVDIIDENKKITQFIESLRKIALTWYMNFNENQSKSKNDIKQNFLTFFLEPKMSSILQLKS